MFPDTANFTDPSYSDPGVDPLTGELPGSESLAPAGLNDPDLIAAETGGATHAQGSTTGASLLGWLNLGQRTAQTIISAERGGYTTRPQVRSKPYSLGSFGTTTGMTLGIIAAVFIIVVLLLRKV